jgi:hypothetical protein
MAGSWGTANELQSKRAHVSGVRSEVVDINASQSRLRHRRRRPARQVRTQAWRRQRRQRRQLRQQAQGRPRGQPLLARPQARPRLQCGRQHFRSCVSSVIFFVGTISIIDCPSCTENCHFLLCNRLNRISRERRPFKGASDCGECSILIKTA